MEAMITMSEMTKTTLEDTIKKYTENGEYETAKRFTKNYRNVKGFDYQKSLDKINETEKKTLKKPKKEE